MFEQILTHESNLNDKKHHEAINKWLVNLSDVEIPHHVKLFLSLGPKFCYPYIHKKEKTKAVHKIITEFETKTNLFPEQEIDMVRGQLTNILHSMHTKKNQRKDTKKIIIETTKFIKMHPEIVTIKADKGNTTVIMKRSEYIEKTKQLLDDDTIYRTTNKDLIKAL